MGLEKKIIKCHQEVRNRDHINLNKKLYVFIFYYENYSYIDTFKFYFEMAELKRRQVGRTNFGRNQM